MADHMIGPWYLSRGRVYCGQHIPEQDKPTARLLSASDRHFLEDESDSVMKTMCPECYNRTPFQIAMLEIAVKRLVE